MATNPQVPQGSMNRVRCSIVVPGIPTLNITSSYMSKRFAKLTWDGRIVHQDETATGFVNSPEPYIGGEISVGILRTQPLAIAWVRQFEDTGVLGEVVIHSDTSAFPARTISNASIITCDPEAFDGLDATVHVMIRGVYYINNSLWNLL